MIEAMHIIGAVSWNVLKLLGITALCGLAVWLYACAIYAVLLLFR